MAEARSIVSKNFADGSSDALLLPLKRFCLILRASVETFFLADQGEKRLEGFLNGEARPNVAEGRLQKRLYRVQSGFDPRLARHNIVPLYQTVYRPRAQALVEAR